jgi:hypothetical protein
VTIWDGGIQNFKNLKIKDYPRQSCNDLSSLPQIKIKGLPSQPLFEHLTPDRLIKDEIGVSGGKFVPFFSR